MHPFKDKSAAEIAVFLGVWAVLLSILAIILFGMYSCVAPKGAPAPVGLSREEMLRQAETELASGDPMEALYIIRSHATQEALQSDPEVRALEDRAIAAGNAQMASQRVSDFAERASDYWPSRLAGMSVEDARTGTDIAQQEIVFQDIARFIEVDADIAQKAEVKTAKAKLTEKLRARQVEMFPKMRKKYTELLATGLWEHNVYVTARGRTLALTGGRFASNANIAATQEQVGQIAELLRFNRVEYRWHDRSDGTYYTWDSPKDASIGYWEGHQFKTVNN